MNRSFFLFLAASRTRSSPLGHACPARCPVRVLLARVSLWSPPLGSTGSAQPPQKSTSAVSGLFAGFFADMEGSDFSRSFFIGFDSSSSRCGPLRYNLSGQAGDLPVLVHGTYLHARVSDHAGSSRHSHYRACPRRLPPLRGRRHPELIYCFRGSRLACRLPCQRFVAHLAMRYA